MLQISDFNFVLSGGGSNSDPSLSLGGEPSAISLNSIALNNLFEDLTSEDSAAGRVDYRCVYLFNENSTDILYRCRVWIYSEVDGGADVQFGATFGVEQQLIVVTGVPTAGTVLVVYNGKTFSWDFSNANPVVLATALESWLVSVDPVGNPSVGALFNGSFYSFLVTWSDFRFHPLIGITGIWKGSSFVITRQHGGSPINSTSIQISEPTSTPIFVTFVDATPDTPVLLGDLRPFEGIPFWIKRTIQSGSDPVNLDGFSLRFSGSPTP